MVNVHRLKQEICEIGDRIYKRGFAAANDGNITYRISENEVLCTPTMHCKGFLKPDDICTIDMNGNQIGGRKKRSSEALLHLEIMKARPEVKSVVHCHPPGDRPSKRHEIDNCVPFLHEELDVVSPRLIIGLGGDAENVLSAHYPDARQLTWPFVKPRTRTPAATYLLFPEHPGSLRFKKTADRAYYAPSLARAIRWGFELG